MTTEEIKTEKEKFLALITPAIKQFVDATGLSVEVKTREVTTEMKTQCGVVKVSEDISIQIAAFI